MNHAAEQLIDAIDWTRLQLDPVNQPDATTAASFVGVLRSRRTPSTGYSADYVRYLRTHATPQRLAKARERLDDALGKPLIGGAHTNPVIAIGDDAVILGMDLERSLRLSSNTLAVRDQWASGPWGTTRGIVDLLRVLLADPEVPDAALVPLFAWLINQLPAEWAWARTWDETLLGNSGHNWYLHTYMGFWAAGLLFPELKGFAQFADMAPHYIEHEARLLMAPDGFTREVSGYHWGTVNHFLHVAALAEANRVSFSSAFHRHFAAMAATLWKGRATNGDVPRFGDAGSSHAADASLVPLRVTAALFQDPHAKYVAEALAPDWQPVDPAVLSFGGRFLLDDYRRLASRRPPVDSALPDTGLYAMRGDWSPAADCALVQTGHIGSVVSSHAHTDLLDLELYARGRLVLLDNCSGPYGDAPERMWRESSAAHNVLTIDGQDHLSMINEWRWNGECTPFVNEWQADDHAAYLSAAHEAYRHLPDRIASVRRKLFYLRNRYFILIDRTTPENDASHETTLHFQVATPSALRDDGSLVTTAPDANLLILPVDGACGEAAIEPCPFPIDGYENPDHLTYTQNGSGGRLFVTLLVPFGATPPDIKAELVPVEADGRQLSPWEATGLRIAVDGETHVYVDIHMHWSLPWTCAGHTAATRRFHSELP